MEPIHRPKRVRLPKLAPAVDETGETRPERLARGTESQFKVRLERTGPGLGPDDIARIVASLRAPVSDVLFETNMLEAALEPGECGGGLRRIAGSMHAIERVIHELQDFAAIQEDRLVLYRRANEMRSLIGETIERVVAPRDRPRIYVDGPPCLAYIDGTRIDYVVATLIREALLASSGDVVIRLDARVDEAEVSVIHGGVPIDVAADNGTWWYACCRIVEAHGGHLDIEHCTAGARFRFLLPRVEPRPIRVLVVDDDRDQLAALSELLRRSGVVVIPADCGSAALVAARELDVAVIDAELPDVPGVQLLEQLRYRCPGLPIIVVSGHQRDSRRVQEMLALSGGLYVGKPIEIAALLSAIVRVTTHS